MKKLVEAKPAPKPEPKKEERKMTDSDPQKAVSGVGRAVTPVPRASGIAKSRSNFAASHLRSARDATLRANAIQLANSGASFGPWFDDMRREVPVAFIMSAAALEAQINEILQDILDGMSSFTPSKEHKMLLKDLKKLTSGDPIEKCRKLALLLDKLPDTGANEWANASLLVTIRNRFMHFKPAWSDDGRDDDNFAKELRKRLPFYTNFEKGGLFFPYGLMTYEWAKWAIHTVLSFETHFTRRLGLTSRFPSESFGLP